MYFQINKLTGLTSSRASLLETNPEASLLETSLPEASLPKTNLPEAGLPETSLST